MILNQKYYWWVLNLFHAAAVFGLGKDFFEIHNRMLCRTKCEPEIFLIYLILDFIANLMKCLHLNAKPIINESSQ